jgi:hypothetical protein
VFRAEKAHSADGGCYSKRISGKGLNYEIEGYDLEYELLPKKGTATDCGVEFYKRRQYRHSNIAGSQTVFSIPRWV